MMGAQTNPRRRWRSEAAPWLLLAAGLVAAYALNFAEMWYRWFPAWRRADRSLYDRIMEGESYYTHSPLVPIVSLIIAVLLIRHTSVPVRRNRLLGSVVLIGSLLFHLASCLARVNFASGFSLIGVLAGLVLLLWGTTALRRLWFPIVFLAFMVPLPEVSIGQMNFRLKMMAADWGVRLANAIGIVAERSGNQVFMEGNKQLVIANVCNGLRTLISLLAFGAIYTYVCRLRGIWRIGLFAMTVPVAVLSNSIRIVGLIAVADIWDPKTATGMFHDLSGLMIYVMAFGMMFGLERAVLGARQLVGRPARILPLFHGITRDPDDEDQWPRMVQAGGSAAGWVAAGLVVIAAGGALWLSRSVPPVWTGQMARGAVPAELSIDGNRLHSYDLEIDETELTILETRDYLFRRYVFPGALPVDFCIVFSEDNRKGTHPPDVCLEGLGREIVAKGDVLLTGVEGRGEVSCRELIVQAGTNRQYFLYTYLCGDTYTGSFWKQQLTIFANSLLSRDASGALIRVSTPVGDDPADARQRAMRLLGAAVPHLDRALR
ncbi:MAG TPA: EpsI family protein [Phycisphaerae bacterium]|nr:EpsI family protein [Phycisphaerae bacterium]